MRYLFALFNFYLFMLFPGLSQAHHSVYGIFDVSRLIEVRAVFDSADLINPHAWFHFNQVDENGEPVLDAAGQPVTWSFETPSPINLRRMGVTENLFKKYDKQVFTIYTSPQRDGGTRGLLDISIFPDGKVLVMGDKTDKRFKPVLEKYGK